MRFNAGHVMVGALGPRPKHVQGICLESWGTAGRSWGIMWCFGMRYFAPWQMMVVCSGFANLRANSSLSSRILPVSGGTGSYFEPTGV